MKRATIQKAVFNRIDIYELQGLAHSLATKPTTIQPALILAGKEWNQVPDSKQLSSRMISCVVPLANVSWSVRCLSLNSLAPPKRVWKPRTAPQQSQRPKQQFPWGHLELSQQFYRLPQLAFFTIQKLYFKLDSQSIKEQKNDEKAKIQIMRSQQNKGQSGSPPSTIQSDRVVLQQLIYRLPMVQGPKYNDNDQKNNSLLS